DVEAVMKGQCRRVADLKMHIWDFAVIFPCDLQQSRIAVYSQHVSSWPNGPGDSGSNRASPATDIEDRKARPQKLSEIAMISLKRSPSKDAWVGLVHLPLHDFQLFETYAPITAPTASTTVRTIITTTVEQATRL